MVNMTSHDHKFIIRKLYREFLEQGNVSIADELLDHNYIEHDPFPGMEPNIEGAKKTIAAVHSSLGNIKANIQEMIAEGNTVAVRLVITATHIGDFMGVPPTNRTLNIRRMDFFRFNDGRITESWMFRDTYGILKQLGIEP